VSRLAGSDRATLQAAAVLGDPVDVAVLAQMLDQPMGSLEASLSELKEHQFLADTGPSALRFTSPIVREVVVDALPHDAAREMHAAAGHALETVLGGGASEQAGRIATHLYEAGDRERAADYFARSGERRLESRQLEGAAKDLARALELVDPESREPVELAQWLSKLATAVRLVRSAPEAVEMCERVIGRVDKGGDVGLRVRARVDAGVILGALHRLDVARTHLAAAEGIAGSDPKLMKLVLAANAGQAIRQGDFKRSLELLDRLQADIAALEQAQGSPGAASCVLVDTGSLEQGLELANAYAPEHLELIGPGAEDLAAGVRNAGCLFVGWPSATAFGDYVAGSNHILPTAGSARFAAGLTPANFRRQMAEVRITPGALPALIEAGAPIADAEGFHLHAESMRARVPSIEDNQTQ